MSTSTLIHYFFRTRKINFILIWLTIVISAASFYTMNGFIETLKLRLYHSARNISSGDIKMVSMKDYKPEQIEETLKILRNQYLSSEMLSFPTMVQRDNADAFLVSVKAVDTLYPFYGTVKLKDQSYMPIQSGMCYIAKEPATQYGIKIGDTLKIGSQNLLVKGVIDELPDQGFSGGSAFSPVLLMCAEDARASGLLQFGSRVSYCKLWKANHPSLTQEIIEKDADLLEEKFNADGIQVSTWKDSQNISRSLFDRLGAYFNILSYTAVILSAIGFYLGLSAFVLKINSESAILYGLGVSKNSLEKTCYHLFFILILSGSLVGLGLGLLAENYLVQQIDSLMVSVKHNEWHLTLILFTLFFCLVSGGIIVRITVKKWIQNLNPLNYHLPFAPTHFSVGGFLLYILFIFSLLIVFSGVQTGVWVPSVALNGMILLLILLLFVFVLMLIWFIEILVRPLNRYPSIYIAAIEFFRNKRQHLPGLIGLVLSSVLVLGIISTRDVLKQKLTIGAQADAPNIFLVDIQKSQLPVLKKELESNSHYRNFHESPLIRARLIHINDIPLASLKEKAKKENQVKRLSFLNRTYNLTYKDALNPSEKIIKGEFWQTGYDGPGISLESDFAKSMAVTLGDRIAFDLAGLTVEGTVTSIRTIDWGSLLPNFFVIFPSKKLENAPQFIIGSAHIDEAHLNEFQNQLGKDFPNISIVNLVEVFKKVQGLFEKVLKVLVVSSILCVISSLVIMASTLLASQEDTAHRNHLLKSISMNRKQILSVEVYEKLFYFVSLITAVLILHIIWNQLLGHWIKESISFDPILFLTYSMSILLLVYLPLLFKIRFKAN